MAIIKTKTDRELSELQKIEEQIRESQRRSRIHHIVIAALGLLLIASSAIHVCEHRRASGKRKK